VATIDELVPTLIDHRGLTPRKLGSDFVDQGVPVISADNVFGGRLHVKDLRRVSESVYRKWMREPLAYDDVLVTSEAPFGEVALFRETGPFCLGQRLFALRPDPNRLIARYLYYYLQSPLGRHRIRERVTGTTADGIRQAELRKVVIDVVPIRHQEAVAAALGALDDKIDLNIKTGDTLDQLTRVLFASWFGTLDPDRIPDGWTVSSLGGHVDVSRGLSYTGAGLADDGIPLHNLDSIYEGGGYNTRGSSTTEANTRTAILCGRGTF
jgi:type I restriction enzyme, S subunit